MLYKGKEFSGAAADAITTAMCSARFPHTAIIEGSSDDERRMMAEAVAAWLVCGKGENGPCGVCPACRKTLSDSHPDIEIFGENKKGVFPVEAVRDIIASSMIVPNEADAKVYIIETVNPLSPQAQNALLKVLEEPPKYAFFIITCPSKAPFLPTVLSRAQVFSLGETQVKRDKTYFEAVDAAKKVTAAAAAADEYSILEASAVFDKNKELLKAALPVMEEIFVSAMKYKCGAGCEPELEETAALLSSRMSLKRLSLLGDRVRELQAALRFNRNYNLILVRLCTLLRAN